MLDDLATDIISLNANNTSDYLLMGDFKARTQTKPDFVSIDYDLLIDINLEDALNDTISEEEILNKLGIPLTRKNSDANSNNYGNKLLDLCKVSSLYIFNGRTGIDQYTGNLTTSRNSIVDYVIGSLLSKCVAFQADEFKRLFSDIHCGIRFRFQSRSLSNFVYIDVNNQNLNTGTLNHQPKIKFIWDESKKSKKARDFQEEFEI